MGPGRFDPRAPEGDGLVRRAGHTGGTERAASLGHAGCPGCDLCGSAYLSAYNARAFGVRDYIAQMMFNSPPGLSDAMDLAKMLACWR